MHELTLPVCSFTDRSLGFPLFRLAQQNNTAGSETHAIQWCNRLARASVTFGGHLSSRALADDNGVQKEALPPSLPSHARPCPVMEWRLSCGGGLQCCVTNRKKIAAFAGSGGRGRERPLCWIKKSPSFLPPSSSSSFPFERER